MPSATLQSDNMKSLRDVLRWGLYAVVGLFALIGLSSILTGSSRQAPAQPAAQAASGPALESTAQSRVAATVAAVTTAVRPPAPTTLAAAPKPQSTNIPTVAPTLAPTVVPTSPPTAIALPKVGESAQLGNWAVNLMKVETAQALGSQFTRKQAQGVFVVLTLGVMNLHNQTSTLNSFDFQMLGPGGINYTVSNDGSTALLGQEPAVLWLSEQIQPGLAKGFRLVFDVNPAVKNYVLEAAKIKFAVNLP
jgi:hypothetical protein